MDTISIRYGETVTLPLDAADADATSATLFIGKAGEVYVLSKTIALTAGKGTFELDSDDTEIPLGTYNYQINVTSGSELKKFPSPDNSCDTCEGDFPKFIVAESLDEQEVVS